MGRPIPPPSYFHAPPPSCKAPLLPSQPLPPSPSPVATTTTNEIASGIPARANGSEEGRESRPEINISFRLSRLRSRLRQQMELESQAQQQSSSSSSSALHDKDQPPRWTERPFDIDTGKNGLGELVDGGRVWDERFLLNREDLEDLRDAISRTLFQGEASLSWSQPLPPAPNSVNLGNSANPPALASASEQIAAQAPMEFVQEISFRETDERRWRVGIEETVRGEGGGVEGRRRVVRVRGTVGTADRDDSSVVVPAPTLETSPSPPTATVSSNSTIDSSSLPSLSTRTITPEIETVLLEPSSEAIVVPVSLPVIVEESASDSDEEDDEEEEEVWDAEAGDAESEGDGSETSEGEGVEEDK